MAPAFDVIAALLVLATCASAFDKYPPKPVDLTTPVQQRIAIYGPNSMLIMRPNF